MKIKQTITLIVGITSLAVTPITWAAGHGGGFGDGGGGHFGGGGFQGGGGLHGGGQVAGGVSTRGGGVGFGGMRGAGGARNFEGAGPRFSSFGHPSHVLPQLNNHRAQGAGPAVARQPDQCGLDAGYPWDYLPYYSNDYYLYDYYADTDPYDNSGATYNIGAADSATIQTVQARLLNLGYYNGSIDGIFGPSTRDAVARFQIANQLNVTGSLSPDTLQSLGLPQATAS